ncbi:hypothetical protein MNV49_000246 [Pseudohyphozyma bogoriensis]|nr:hypothetical protein MNV49_000246 [Pseudohyphozyma bogoriensis]
MSTSIASPPVLVVSGLGNGVGTGAATARLFAAQLGYRVALVSRPRQEVQDLKSDINKLAGADLAQVFALEAYDHENMAKVFDAIKQHWPDSRIRCAVWNTGQWSNIPFLDIKESDIKLSAQVNIVAATSFSQNAVKAFLAPASSGEEVGGTLIMTGATSAWRGAAGFGAFAAGKHGLRALSQSIAREYGPKGVHVAFVVIDGTIRTKRTLALFGDKKGEGWLNDDKKAMSAESIAKCYLYLHQQDPGCWTLEMDLRPSQEKF